MPGAYAIDLRERALAAATSGEGNQARLARRTGAERSRAAVRRALKRLGLAR